MKRLFAPLLCLVCLLVSCQGAPFLSLHPNGTVPSSSTSAPAQSTSLSSTAAPATHSATVPPESSASEAPKVEEVRLSVLAAGDNVIHPCIYKEAKTRATKDTREYNFKPTYQDIIPLVEAADIAFINQETLMGGEELGYSGYPRFNSPQDLAYDLQEIGFDVVSIANNHMCDKGEKGLKNTIEFWNTLEGVTLLGGHLNEEDFWSIRVTEQKGVRIAWLSYTYGTNGLSLPSQSELYIPYIDRENIQKQLELAESIADLSFVSIHWGEENHFEPETSQRSLAQFMADHGADVIIGHHPHVIQPIEWLEGAEGNQTLCIYSLGNLISAMNNGYNMLGGLFTFDVVRDENGTVFVEAPLFVPTAFFYADNWFSTKLYLLENYTQEKSLTHGSRTHGKLATRETMIGYLHDVMDEQFLPDWLKEE